MPPEPEMTRADWRRRNRPYRVVEIVGLVTMGLGLMASHWLAAPAGVVLTFGPVILWRRRYGDRGGPDQIGMGMGDGGD